MITTPACFDRLLAMVAMVAAETMRVTPLHEQQGEGLRHCVHQIHALQQVNSCLLPEAANTASGMHPECCQPVQVVRGVFLRACMDKPYCLVCGFQMGETSQQLNLMYHTAQTAHQTRHLLADPCHGCCEARGRTAALCTSDHRESQPRASPVGYAASLDTFHLA